MVIALVTRSYDADGGVAIHVRRSAAALREAGHEVVIAAADTPDGEGVRCAGLANSPLALGEAAGLARQLAATGAELVHFHNVDDSELVRLTGRSAATVVSAHGWSGCPSGTRMFGSGRECVKPHGPLCIPNMLFRNCDQRRDPRPVLNYYREGRERLAALRAADLAVAHSTAVRHHLQNNSVSAVAIVPLPVSIPDRTVEPPVTPRVAFVGRLTVIKGAGVLLRSADHFDAEIDICGDGPARPGLERLARKLRISGRVTFHGWLDQGEVAALYDGAHIAVVPSLYPEPFGMTGPEALAHARPVVGSSTGGTGDWLEDGVTGVAVPPGDPRALGVGIARLLADPVALHAMGVAGRKVAVERFTAAAHLTGVLDAYRCATERAASRHGGSSSKAV